MKKIIFSAAVLFAAVAGYTSYNNSSVSDDEMSDLMKANIEALAGAPVNAKCVSGGDYCFIRFGGITFESTQHHPE